MVPRSTSNRTAGYHRLRLQLPGFLLAQLLALSGFLLCGLDFLYHEAERLFDPCRARKAPAQRVDALDKVGVEPQVEGVALLRSPTRPHAGCGSLSRSRRAASHSLTASASGS